MNHSWPWQLLCRTTLEIAPFDGISRFRFKGSSGKSGVLSQRLPCVHLVNYEPRRTSMATGIRTVRRSTFGVQRLGRCAAVRTSVGGVILFGSEATLSTFASCESALRRNHADPPTRRHVSP